MNAKNNVIVLFAILIITIEQGIDIYIPSMPSMVIALNTTAAMIQFSITIGLIGYGVAALIYGPMSDYFGRRMIALVGLGIFICGSILCVIATNIPVLLLGRVLQGIGFASACGVSAPAVCDIFTGPELVKAFSYIGMAMAMMPIIAPVLGGYLHDYFNWRAPFIFLLAYSAILFVLFFKWFPETKKVLRQSSIRPLEIIKNYISILGNSRFWGFVLCGIFIFCGETFYTVISPFLLQTKLGLSAIQNGWLLLVTVGGFLLGSFSSNIMCKKFSIVELSLFGSIISVSSAFIMLLLAFVAKMSVLTIILPMILYMYGVGLIYTNAGAGCMGCVPGKAGFLASLGGTLSLGIGGILTSLFVASVHVENQLTLSYILLLLAILSLSSLWLVRAK